VPIKVQIILQALTLVKYSKEETELEVRLIQMMKSLNTLTEQTKVE